MSNTETTTVETVNPPAVAPNAPAEEIAKTDQPTEVVEVNPETPKEEKKQDKFAPKFAALSRKEREQRQREKEFEAQKKKWDEELAAREKALQERETKAQARERLKKESPAKWLEEEGVSYEDVTRSILNNGELTRDQKLDQLMEAQAAEIKKLQERLEAKEKKEQEDAEKAETDALEKKHQESIASFKTEIDTFLKGSKEHELVNALTLEDDEIDPVTAVYDVVAEYYKEHKEILDTKAAADLLEKHLESRLEKLTKLEKAKAKFTPPKEEPKQEPAQSQSPKTLENAQQAQTPNRQARKLTADERIAEAAKHVKWLKN